MVNDAVSNSEIDLSWINEEKLRTNDAYCFDLFKDAFARRDKNFVKLLIEKGANVNAKDEGGWTLLHCAVSMYCSCEIRGNRDCLENPPLDKDIVSLLSESGANVNAKNSNGVTPLKLSIGRMNNNGITELLVNAGANVDDVDDYTIFPWAVADGKKEIIESRLDRGLDVNAQDLQSTEWTMLHYAVSFGQKDMVEFLINKGADINKGAGYYRNVFPLHLIGKGDYKSIGELLISKGAEINIKDLNGRTPLYYVIDDNCDINVVKFLIDKGADINVKDVNDVTPLHLAAQKNNIGVAGLLIDRGADVNAKDNSNETPLGVTSRDNKEMIELLQEAIHNSTTINSMEDIIASNKSNGIFDIRNSETTTILSTAPIMLPNFYKSAKNISLLSSGGNIENSALDNISSSSSINGSAPQALIGLGLMFFCIFKKVLSSYCPATAINTPSLDQNHKSQLGK